MAKDGRKSRLSEAPVETLKTPPPKINRCYHETCVSCRKHASCFIQPRPDGGCVGYEEGEAWDHECKGS